MNSERTFCLILGAAFLTLCLVISWAAHVALLP